MFIGEDVKALIESILNDKGWGVSDYTFDRGSTSIWIGNGILFVDFYPSVSAFNIFEKVFIFRAIRKRIIKDTIK